MESSKSAKTEVPFSKLPNPITKCQMTNLENPILNTGKSAVLSLTGKKSKSCFISFQLKISTFVLVEGEISTETALVAVETSETMIETSAFGRLSSGQAPWKNTEKAFLCSHKLHTRCDIDGYDGDGYDYIGSSNIIDDVDDDAVIIGRTRRR